jgi:GrpB-like predicted nucleotidyltransferase (UPF0157 family)
LIGQHKRNINIIPYQPGWVELYEREAERLLEVLGEQVLTIEHIGSTSIPGMQAKPVIDMMTAIEIADRGGRTGPSAGVARI